MRKLWINAKLNIKKDKKISIVLVITFSIAAFLLSTGLLVLMNYGSFFSNLTEELSTSNAYVYVTGDLYTEEVPRILEENEYVTSFEMQEVITRSITFTNQNNNEESADQILFQNMDEEREMSKWKFVGEHLEAEEMSVYIPDVLRTTRGYELNDELELTYTNYKTGLKESFTCVVKGYIEDVYFSSVDTGMLGFYFPEETYSLIKDKLNEQGVTTDYLFYISVDDFSNLSSVETELREYLQLNSTSILVNNDSTVVILDLELIEMARCIMSLSCSALIVLFSIIVILVCLLIVHFRIVNNIEEDMPKIGSLKSVGYTSRQIISSILLQYATYVIISSIIGIILSYICIPFVSLIFQKQSGLRWEPGFDVLISMITFIVILLITEIIVVLAARRIKKITPVNALRGYDSQKKYKRNHFSFETTRLNLVSTLGLKSFVQNIKQSIMIIIILTVVTFMGTFGIIMYYNTTIDTRAFAEVPGLEIGNVITILNPELDHEETVQMIKDMSEVEKANYYDEVSAKLDGAETTFHVMEDYKQKETQLVYEGRYPEGDQEIVLAGNLAQRIDKKIGDKVLVSIGDKEESFEIVGFSNGANMGGMDASIRTADYQKLNPNFKPQLFYIYLKDDVDTKLFIQDLETIVNKDIVLKIIDFDKEMEKGMAPYQSVASIMGISMLIISLTVTALSLYFIVISFIIHNKKEIGIKKSLGFTTLQIMHEISLSFFIPIILGSICGIITASLKLNDIISISMKSAGVMKTNFIVESYWIIGFGLFIIVFFYIFLLLITRSIKKISAYTLITE